MLKGAMMLLAAYLLGGIPFGYLFYKALNGDDIRSVGSGNIGATNVGREGGWRIGVLTLILDGGKGAAAVYLGLLVTGDPRWAGAAAFFAIAGHCFPVWLKFHGGKGVATGAGAFLLLHPLAMAGVLAIFGLATGVTRMVAVGSISAALSFPIISWLVGGEPAPVLWSAGAAILIVVRHHENISRIIRGEEKRMWGENR
jgi:glycerol-3-phosphate acyltransferase PlsY